MYEFVYHTSYHILGNKIIICRHKLCHQSLLDAYHAVMGCQSSAFRPCWNDALAQREALGGGLGGGT